MTAASSSKKVSASKSQQRSWWQQFMLRRDNFLARRPHRSFRRTRRRDYARPLAVPGYVAFTSEVAALMWQHRRLFTLVIATYVGLTILFVGISSQSTYTQLSDELRTSGAKVFEGEWSELNQAGILLLGGASGSFSAAPSDVQQVYAVIIGLLMWLTVVWLVRAIKAGKQPRLRDGLYTSGAPIVPTMLVTLIGCVQLIPLLVAVIGFGAAQSAGILSGGVEAMLFSLLLVSLGILSLYWLTSTVVALVVVTLPGMRPVQAMKTAGDLVIGRRARFILRLLWLAVVLAVIWLAVLLPVILIDTWLKGAVPVLQVMPIVPVMLAVMSAFSMVSAAIYIYLLYRRMVDDESTPA